MRKGIISIIACCLGLLPLQASLPLKERILQIVENADAQVGVALIINGKDTITVNNHERYPLMSVMKYHQALAVAHYLDEHCLPLSTSIPIEQEDLHPDTYSPLRDRYPKGGVRLAVSELLTYTLQLSDNNACDILFDYTGGVAQTESYLHSIGCSDFALSATENDMHQDLSRCYDNWSTPLSAAQLMDCLVADTLPIDTTYTHFIRETLLSCQTGKSRLPFPLQGTDVQIGHKTGTSDRNAQGEWTGINDVGFVLLPNGQWYTLAVLVKHSKHSFEDTEKIIADVSTAVFRFLAGSMVSL